MNKKALFGALLALALVAVPAGAVFAAPATQTDVLTGIVRGIVIQTDELGAQTGVLVTVEDSTGALQEVVITLEEAALLGLVTQDPVSLLYTVNATAVCAEGATDCVPVTFEGVEVVTHPVALALAAFFGLTANEVMAVHDEGVGFGVIAQAMWLSSNIGGDASLFDEIVQAKQDKDFSGIVLPDGTTSSATNWGQFKQELSEHGQNLGCVMSEKCTPPTTETTLTTTTTTLTTSQGQGNGRGNHGGNGKGKGHNK